MQDFSRINRCLVSSFFCANAARILFLSSLLAPAVFWAQSPPASRPAAIQPPSVQTGAIQIKPAQAPNQTGPIAIVSLDNKEPGSASMVTGALQVSGGRAMIASSGAITSGASTTDVALPHRGMLRVCASTTVKLSADSSVPAGEIPGIMMAIDHGAIEASFATGRNSDILLTPDFRILIGGPGAADVKVRMGQHGDTCVDNAGINAPYVLVTSVFDGSMYRVQAGQRVMFQHGSILEVVDQEKEPCGCPPASHSNSNEFPLAQSAGLAPLAPPGPAGTTPTDLAPAAIDTFVYKSGERAPEPPVVVPQKGKKVRTGHGATETANAPTQKKPGFFTRMGHFFRRLFGAE